MSDSIIPAVATGALAVTPDHRRRQNPSKQDDGSRPGDDADGDRSRAAVSAEQAKDTSEAETDGGVDAGTLFAATLLASATQPPQSPPRDNRDEKWALPEADRHLRDRSV